MKQPRQHARTPASPLLIFAAAVFAVLAAGPAYASDSPEEEKCPSLYAEAADDALHMAVFGDSIMWGQGLDEPNKFWCRVRGWLESKTKRRVNVEVFAHSGAVIEPQDGEVDKLDGFPAGGEVNHSFPTIGEQVERASARYIRKGKKVDLVLVDGCINDVNVRNLLDASKSPTEDIAKRTREKCGRPMEKLLRKITATFPCAIVVVTGYYPLINRPRVIDGEKVGGTSNNFLTRSLVKKLMGTGPNAAWLEPKDLIPFLGLHSEEWYKTSNESLAAAVASENEKLRAESRAQRVYFAEIQLPAEHAFSTKQSMLWNFKFGATNFGGLRKAIIVITQGFGTFNANDQRWDERAGDCTQAYKALKRGGRAKENKDFRRLCRYASLGHPNRLGATLYAQAITGQLHPVLPQIGRLKKMEAAAPAESTRAADGCQTRLSPADVSPRE